jgi:glycosyltransferase involved in cell wall biosynthesis
VNRTAAPGGGPIRVAVASHDVFWPLRGGGGIRVYWVTAALARNGDRVHVVAPFLHGRGLCTAFPGISFGSTGRYTRFVRFKEAVYAVLMVRTFFRLLAAAADVFYAHNVVAGLPALAAGRLRKIPVVFDMDDLLTGYSKNRWVYRFGSGLEKRVARLADAVIVPTRFGASWVGDWGAKRIEIIRHGADLERFRPRPSAARRRTVVFIGGMEPNDGVLLVPEAAEKILRRFPEIRFLFVGEGKALPELERSARTRGVSENFEIRGWVDQAKIPEILSGSEIGLITSLEVSATVFSAPLRSYEYMASGLPYAASDLPGIREQTEESGAGLLFRPGDGAALAEVLIRLLSDGRLRRRLGGNGRSYAERNGDWMSAGLRIAGVCESAALAAGKKTSGPRRNSNVAAGLRRSGNIETVLNRVKKENPGSMLET